MEYQVLFLFFVLFSLYAGSFHFKPLAEKKPITIKTDKNTVAVHPTSSGDVNGDGYPDVFICKETYEPISTSYLLYGGPTDSLKDLDLEEITPKQGLKIQWGVSYAVKSCSATLVDLNKDGYADIVIMTGVDFSQWEKVYVVFGGSNLTDVNINSMNSTQGFTIGLPKNKYTRPAKVSPVGDINADGYQDVAIQDVSDPNTYIIYGGPSLSSFDITSMDSKQGSVITKIEEDYHWSGISAAGDINNDGIADFLIATNSYIQEGNAVNVIYGRKNFSDLNIELMTSQQGFKISIPVDKSMMPKSVSSAGDVNKDGYSDILIGHGWENNGLGLAYIVYGGKNLTNLNTENLTQSQGIKIIGEKDPLGYDRPRFGHSVSSAGDFNKDGYADVVIGAPWIYNEKGAFYVIYGGKSLSDIAVENMTSTQGFKMTKPESSEEGGSFGLELYSVGDMNKDGYDDIITVDTFAKKAIVIFGKANA